MLGGAQVEAVPVNKIPDKIVIACEQRDVAAVKAWLDAGGKERVDFSGPLTREQLGAIGKPRLAQEMSAALGGWRAGVFPMQPEITKEFVTRNIMRDLDSSA